MIGHGTDRQAMETHRAPVPYERAESSRQRKTTASFERGAQRDFVDFKDRRPMEQASQLVSALSNLPSEFSEMGQNGVVRENFVALAQDLKEHGGIDVRECFIDGSFVSAKKGPDIGKSKRGKGTFVWVSRTFRPSCRPMHGKCFTA